MEKTASINAVNTVTIKTVTDLTEVVRRVARTDFMGNGAIKIL